MLSLRGLRSHSVGAPARHSSGGAQGGIFSALRFRNYRLFWFGQLISVTGTFMQSTAQQWLVLTLTSNPIALGIVGALQFGPLLIPFGGAIADRFPRRRVLVVTQVAAGILAVALFLLTVTHTVQLWHVYLLALLLGVVNAVDMPTRQAFVTEMVPSEYLLNAVSLNSAQFNASRIVGPGLAGAMIAIFGTPLLFLLNAVSYIAVIVGLVMMRQQELVPAPHAALQHGLARLRAMGDGARFVFSKRDVLVTFLLVAVIGTMGFNFNVLLPLEAKGELHAGSAIFGLLTSSLGVGALIGALLLARRRGSPSNVLLVTMAGAFGILEASVALSHSVALVMFLMAITGFTMSTFAASANTRVQLASPPELRGRVMGVYTMVSVGTTPIGNLLISAVAGIGVPVSFALSGLPCLASALVAGWLWRDSLRAAPARRAQPAAASALVAREADTNDVPPMAENVTADLARPSASGRRPALPSQAPGLPKLQPRAADHQ